MNPNLPIDGDLGGGLYRTYQPSITEWKHGDVRERIVIPPGETTDFSSFPEKGPLGWLARSLGFKKDAPWSIRSGKIHDELYFTLKERKGILPAHWYQFFNPETNAWEDVLDYQWNRQQADAVWRRISIEDGCPVKTADLGYNCLRVFGGAHMLLH